ncbi:MAG: phenylacetate--CoA ligase family protein, partial [Desulfohalobiaceae bacterium]|nr:phenylacetate--CoA ligase family protein [Desulfohalobiaceae bacterium]
RTRDLCRLIPGVCSCGLELPLHDRILGRSDDMFIFRGVNIYPGQIAEVLETFPEAGSEYQIVLERHQGRDVMLLHVERTQGASSDADLNLSRAISLALRKQLLVTPEVKVVDPGDLPRSFGKSKRLLDRRNDEMG